MSRYTGKMLEAQAEDEHLNQISVKKWYRLAGFVFGMFYTDRKINGSNYAGTLNFVGSEFYNKLKEAGDGFSSSSMVCTLKAAVRKLAEEN